MAFLDLVASVDAATLQHLGGEDVVYAPAVGDPVTISGLFDGGYQANQYGFAGAERYDPSVFFVVADLPTDPDTDEPTLTIRGLDYKVRERVRDGLGGIRLNLYLAASP